MGHASCPLCGALFTSSSSYRLHLGSEHGLFDEPGTVTVIPEPPPVEAPSKRTPLRAPARKPAKKKAPAKKTATKKKAARKRA